MAITFDLTSNAVVNAGETASFEVSNIQGVPVSGCPIGKTFYSADGVIFGGTYTSISETNSASAEGLVANVYTPVSKPSSGFTRHDTFFGLNPLNENYGLRVGVDLYFDGSYILNITYNNTQFQYSKPAELVGYTIDTQVGSRLSTEAYGGTFEALVWVVKLHYLNGSTETIDLISDRGITSFMLSDTMPFWGRNITADIEMVTDSGLPNNCTGEVPDATIEYYRNGVLDYTGNPWSFPADGSMDGDSIVARVSSGVDSTDSDPVELSVLHYTNEPPSPQNLAEGDPLSLAWDIAGVTGGVESKDFSHVEPFFGAGYVSNTSDTLVFTSPPIQNLSATSSTFSIPTGYIHIDYVHTASVNEGSVYFSIFQVYSATRGELVFTAEINAIENVIRVSRLTASGVQSDTVPRAISSTETIHVVQTYNSGNLDTDIYVGGTLLYSSSFDDLVDVSGDSLFYRAVCGAADSTISNFSALVGTGVNQIDYTVNKNGAPVDSGSTTDTTISYSIPSVALGDAGNYDLTITNGGRDPFQSDIVVVNVGSAVSSHLPFAGYSTEIKLGLSIQKGHYSNQVVYDFGQTSDEYTSEIEYYSESEADFPRSASNIPNNVKEDGFYPFAPHITNSVLNGYRYPKFAGKYNYLGNYWRWDVEVIPADVSAFEYAPYTWAFTSVTNFSFGDLVNFPVPDISPVSEYRIQYNRSGNVIREYDKGAGSSARVIKIKWRRLQNDQCAALLSYIVNGVRSSQINVDFGDMAISSPWVGRQGETGTIFPMRLSDPVIKVKHRSGNLWDVEIEMLKVEA